MSSTWVIGKYTLFQLPGLAFLGTALFLGVSWFGLPMTAAWVIAGLWVLKDVVMFPFVRVAYESASSGGVDSLVGAFGVAKESLAPRGYVQVGSEAWRAEVPDGHEPIPEGSAVRVRDVRGLTLLVEPSSGDAP